MGQSGAALYKTVTGLVDTHYFFFNEADRCNWEEIKMRYEPKFISECTDYRGIASEMLIELHDPHTRLFYTRKNNPLFQLHLKWFDHQLYLVEEGAAGQEAFKMLSINDQNIEDLIRQFQKRFTAYPIGMVRQELIQSIVMGSSYEALKVELTDGSTVRTSIYYPVTADNRKQLQSMVHRISRSTVLIKRLEQDILYVRLLTFRAQNIEEVILKSREQFEACESIIFDLRDNSGGFMKEASEVASLFLEEDIRLGYQIVTPDDTGVPAPPVIPVIQGKKRVRLHRKRIYLLFDENTMSSAEYVFLKSLIAAYPNAVTVGHESAGLSGQAKIFHLPQQEAVIQVTCRRYVDQDMREIKQGITPNRNIALHMADYLLGIDTQLQYCIASLKQKTYEI
ncbi:Peptidase family S41 [compost metagenome]